MPDLGTFKNRAAILFDLDGTLYSRHDYAAYFDQVDRITGRRIAACYGVTGEREAFDRLVADQRRLGLPSKSDALEKLFGIGLAEMNRWREAHSRPEDHLRPDRRLAVTLEDLGSRFTLALGTNNAPGLAARILAALGIPPSRFAAIVTSEDAGAAKPEPSFFACVTRRVGLSPDAFVSVGDTPGQDVAPAIALGMGGLLVASMPDVYGLAGARP